MSEGLAETFCLSDPARHDNPILFASEGKPFPSKLKVHFSPRSMANYFQSPEFNRMTQYSVRLT